MGCHPTAMALHPIAISFGNCGGFVPEGLGRWIAYLHANDGKGTAVNFKDIKVGGLSSTASKAIDRKYDPEKVLSRSL